MKPYTYALLAAAAACGLAQAADTAYTTPVGYTTQTLAANSYNLIGFNVLSPSLASGDLTGVSGATLSDSAVDFTALLTAGRTYVIEIKDGPGTADGTVQDFATWSGSDMTLPSAVAGVAVGDIYNVRLVPKLSELLGTSVAASFTSAGADIVWVPNGSGGYVKYWKNSTTWRQLVTGAATDPAEDPSVLYSDGIWIQKKAVAGSLVLSGEVKKTDSKALIASGYNPISIIPPVGSTLLTCGLIGDLAPGFTSAGADIVWIPAGGGTFDKYGLKSPAPGVWYKLDASGNFLGSPATDFDLPASILIQRKTTAKEISFNVPSSYSNL